MNMHRSSRKSMPKSANTTGYMSVREKKQFSVFEVKCEKPRRWGCFPISIALIALVLLVAVVVTTLYVLLFTDLVSHLFKGHTAPLSRDLAVNETLPPTSTVPPMVTSPARHRDLRILVMVVDTRTHNVDNNAFKQTIEAWRRMESVWKDMFEKGAITDRLSVMQCQGCKTIGIKDDQRGPTIFYTVEHLRSDSHSFNVVVFVALPTPPGEILSTLTSHGRTNHLGDVCRKGSWSATGCDFEVRGKALPEAEGGNKEEDTRQSHFNFRIQPVALTETALLAFNKTIVMQKDFTTFKVLISQPMAV